VLSVLLGALEFVSEESVEGDVKTVRTLVRRFVWINLALAVPSYAYFMYQLKQAGMW
jgi:hypothetical protein